MKALRIFHTTPLGRHYMGMVWEWAKANAAIYLDGEFETKEQFCAPPPAGVTEYIIFLRGDAVAHLGLWEEARGTRIALITAPYAPRRLLMLYLRQLAQFAMSRGAHLFTTLPASPEYASARKLGRFIGIENYGQ